MRDLRDQEQRVAARERVEGLLPAGALNDVNVGQDRLARVEVLQPPNARSLLSGRDGV